MIDALRKLQAKNEAEAATNIMIKRKDFNELYDPTTGAPEGSEGQLWTATAALVAINYFRS